MTIDRSKYVYEGPGGVARDHKDYSPNTRMTDHPFERAIRPQPLHAGTHSLVVKSTAWIPGRHSGIGMHRGAEVDLVDLSSGAWYRRSWILRQHDHYDENVGAEFRWFVAAITLNSTHPFNLQKFDASTSFNLQKFDASTSDNTWAGIPVEAVVDDFRFNGDHMGSLVSWVHAKYDLLDVQLNRRYLGHPWRWRCSTDDFDLAFSRCEKRGLAASDQATSDRWMKIAQSIVKEHRQ